MKIHYSTHHYVRGIERHTYTLDPTCYNCGTGEALDLVLSNLPTDAMAFVFELSGPELSDLRSGR